MTVDLPRPRLNIVREHHNRSSVPEHVEHSGIVARWAADDRYNLTWRDLNGVPASSNSFNSEQGRLDGREGAVAALSEVLGPGAFCLS